MKIRKLAGILVMCALVCCWEQNASAQKLVPVKPVTGMKSFQIGGSRPKSTSSIVYSNTLQTGWYAVPGIGEEWIDWGPTRAAAAEHGTITHGTFGYATSAATGPTVRWRTYDGYTGGCISLTPGGLDLSITGLPGTVFTLGATAWTIETDLADAGACFYLPNGSFGYSLTFSDSLSGNLLCSGDNAENSFDWVSASTGSCSPGYFFRHGAWGGWYTEFLGRKTSDTFGSGCNGPISLSVVGNSCPGGALTVTLSGPGPDQAPFSAIGLGSTVGTGIGGPLREGCSWDVGLAPGVPPVIHFLGSLPLAFSFGANTCAGAAPGTLLGAQWVQKDTITGILSTSNVVEIFVP